MKHIYLSGPMTGIPAFNFPAFNAESARLRSLGYDVVNPAEINQDNPGKWHDCLRRDLIELMKCDTVALLEGWQHSSGAHLEMHVAHRVGMEIIISSNITEPALADGGGVEVLRLNEPMHAFDLVAHLYRQREFSLRTFGPGSRLNGVLAHIRKELVEIESDPSDVSEWIDLLLLGFDGAWRQGSSPEAIAAALASKQTRNEGRMWPDWRQCSEDEPIQHVRVATEGAPT